MDGTATTPRLRAGAASNRHQAPAATHTAIVGQDHAVLHIPAALVPALTEFFA